MPHRKSLGLPPAVPTWLDFSCATRTRDPYSIHEDERL